jgi:hypothetical protein
MNQRIEWVTRIGGWHWVGPDGWEIIRSLRSEDRSTQYTIFHNNMVVDIRATLPIARLTAESEITRERIS